MTNGALCQHCGHSPCLPTCGMMGDERDAVAAAATVEFPVGRSECSCDDLSICEKCAPLTVAVAKALASKIQPLFEQRANATLSKVTATFGQRGTEYGDTWRNCRFVVMKAIARELRLNIPDDAYRALATAAFVDMKYQRNEGGYKEDSLIDGIAYGAFLADEMRELKEGKA